MVISEKEVNKMNNNHLLNKKGVSAVVANVLIILLVVVGVALIWAAVRPSIEESAEGIQADCFTLQVQPVSCTDAGSGAWDVAIKRNPGQGDLQGISFQFTDASGNSAVLDESDSGVSATTAIGSLQELASSTFTMSAPAGFTPAEVNIAVQVGAQQRLCDITTASVPCGP